MQALSQLSYGPMCVGRHDTKPEVSRLTTNAITGLKPRRTRYDVTDPGSAGVQLRVMPGGAKCWYFRFYWRNKRQRLGLGQWPAVGLAQARARAQQAREVLDEGIDPSRRMNTKPYSGVDSVCQPSPARRAQAHAVPVILCVRRLA